MRKPDRVGALTAADSLRQAQGKLSLASPSQARLRTSLGMTKCFLFARKLLFREEIHCGDQDKDEERGVDGNVRQRDGEQVECAGERVLALDALVILDHRGIVAALENQLSPPQIKAARTEKHTDAGKCDGHQLAEDDA